MIIVNIDYSCAKIEMMFQLTQIKKKEYIIHLLTMFPGDDVFDIWGSKLVFDMNV